MGDILMQRQDELETKLTREAVAADLERIREDMQDFALGELIEEPIETRHVGKGLEKQTTGFDTNMHFYIDKLLKTPYLTYLSNVEKEELEFFKQVLLNWKMQKMGTTFLNPRDKTLLSELTNIKKNLMEIFNQVSEKGGVINPEKRKRKFEDYKAFLRQYAALTFWDPENTLRASTLYQNLFDSDLFKNEIAEENKLSNINHKTKIGFYKMEKDLADAYQKTHFAKEKKMTILEEARDHSVENLHKALNELKPYLPEDTFTHVKNEIGRKISDMHSSSTKDEIKQHNKELGELFKQIQSNIMEQIKNDPEKLQSLQEMIITTGKARAMASDINRNPIEVTNNLLSGYMGAPAFVDQLAEPFANVLENQEKGHDLTDSNVTLDTLRSKLASTTAMPVQDTPTYSPPASMGGGLLGGIMNIVSSAGKLVAGDTSGLTEGRRASTSAPILPISENKKARTLFYRDSRGEARRRVFSTQDSEMQKKLEDDLKKTLAQKINEVFKPEVMNQYMTFNAGAIPENEINVKLGPHFCNISFPNPNPSEGGRFTYLVAALPGVGDRFSVTILEPTDPDEEVKKMKDQSNSTLFYRYAIANAIADSLNVQKIKSTETQQFISALENVVKAEVAAEHINLEQEAAPAVFHMKTEDNLPEDSVPEDVYEEEPVVVWHMPGQSEASSEHKTTFEDSEAINQARDPEVYEIEQPTVEPVVKRPPPPPEEDSHIQHVQPLTTIYKSGKKPPPPPAWVETKMDVPKVETPAQMSTSEDKARHDAQFALAIKTFEEKAAKLEQALREREAENERLKEELKLVQEQAEHTRNLPKGPSRGTM